MKFRTLTLGTLAVCMLAGMAAPAVAAPRHRNENDAPILIGHRGAAGVAPENTLAAFKAGSQSGADFVELDVQLSRDGVPFIFHDDTPARTTNVEEVFPERVNAPITSFSWNELQQLDAGSYFSAEFAGEKIPHFDAVADVLTGNTGVFIEIKSPAKSPGVEQVVADALANDPEWSALEKDGQDRGPGLRRKPRTRDSPHWHPRFRCSSLPAPSRAPRSWPTTPRTPIPSAPATGTWTLPVRSASRKPGLASACTP